MMFDLFVDDMRSPPEGWTLARTFEEAQALLATRRVRKLSLDHDLGMCGRCEAARPYDIVRFCPHRPTGLHLVEWMAMGNFWSFERPVVHGGHIVGTMQMEDAIDHLWPHRGRELTDLDRLWKRLPPSQR